jgi:hypothetical protein
LQGRWIGAIIVFLIERRLKRPVSKNPLLGPDNVYSFAQIYVMVGEYEEALDQIEYLLSIPNYYLSVPLLRLDPTWDSLREYPRFKQLLEKYSEQEE